jgi:hypothetical protein
MDYETLLVRDDGDHWRVVGTSYSNAMNPEPGSRVLKASLLTIAKVKELLAKGVAVGIPKMMQFPEAQLSDIIEISSDELTTKIRIAVNDISTAMQQMIIGVSVIDVMEYMNNYVKLLNAGYFITDANREDKYFEIIEKSQDNPEPSPLPENPTFDQEQEYTTNMRNYMEAKENLSTLEKYLNAYDRIAKVKYVYELMDGTRQKVMMSKTPEDVDAAVGEYLKKIQDFKS